MTLSDIDTLAQLVVIVSLIYMGSMIESDRLSAKRTHLVQRLRAASNA
jgi:hypothetical protein